MSCYHGAQKAAADLGVDLISWGGRPSRIPTARTPSSTNGSPAAWMRSRRPAMTRTAFRRPPSAEAESRGIKVITYDADAQPDARAFFINQATAESIGTALMDDAANLCGGAGQYAMITANLTSANENGWRHWIDERNRMYPGIKMVAIRPCDDNIEKARVESVDLLKSYPDLKLIMAICTHPGFRAPPRR